MAALKSNAAAEKSKDSTFAELLELFEFRLLQQYLPKSDSRTAAKMIVVRLVCMGLCKLRAFISLSRKPVLMCVKLSGGKATSSKVLLASIGARHDKMWCKMVDNY